MSHWCNKCRRVPYNGCDLECPVFGLEYEDLAKKLFEKNEEAETLNKEVDRLSQVILYHDGQIVDTIKDFAERACDRLRTGNIIMDKSIADIVNQIANDMLEELK